MLMMKRKNSSRWWIGAFPPCVTLYDETKSQFGCGYPQTAHEIPESLILISSHTAEIGLLLKARIGYRFHDICSVCVMNE